MVKASYILSANEIARIVSAVCQQYPVSHAYLFGSYARSQQKNNSDIDLYIMFEDSQPISGLLAGQLYSDLQQALSSDIDIVFSTTQVSDIKKPSLRSSIERDKVLLYDSKSNDDARVFEIFKVIQTARTRINFSSISHDEFVSPENYDVSIQSIVDGITLCVYRVAEEANALSSDFKNEFSDIPWAAIRGLRNIVAHAYGEVNPEIVWQTIISDFPTIEEMCIEYAEKHRKQLPDHVSLD